MLTAVTIIFTLGTSATVDGIIHDPALGGDLFDVLIRSDKLSAEQMQTILASHSEIANLYTRTGADALATNARPGTGRFLVRGMEGGYATAGFLVPEGRMFSAPGEAVVGRALLDELGLHVGDTLTINVFGQPNPRDPAGQLTLHIVGRFVTDDDDGRMLMLSQETLQTVLPNAQPNEFAVQLKPGADLDAFEAAIYRETNYDVSMENGLDETPPEVPLLRRVLYSLSAVLLVIGMINLVSTTLLNVRERRRDIGIGKAIGLTPIQVTASVVTGVATLATLAALLGIPAGLLIYRAFYQIIAVGMLDAQADWYAGPSWWSLALIVPGAIAVAALASGVPARLAARMSVAEALRSE